MFGRLVTAMITPFDSNLEVDLKKAKLLAQKIEKNGSSGIVVAGTTGESPVLTSAEKIKLFEAVKDAVSEDTAVIAGTGTNNTNASMKLTKEAEAVGVDGVMSVVPYYNKPSQDGLYEHFKHIASATKLPIMLYNVPSRTSRNIMPETVARLSAIDNITAIKEAANDVEQATRLRRLCPEDFKLFSGNDTFTLPLLSLGGYGVVSVASHLVGNEIKTMITEYVKGNVEKAWKLNVELFALFKAMFITSNPVPLKTALSLTGFDVGGVRLPLIPMKDEEIESLKEVLSSYDII